MYPWGISGGHGPGLWPPEIHVQGQSGSEAGPSVFLQLRSPLSFFLCGHDREDAIPKPWSILAQTENSLNCWVLESSPTHREMTTSINWSPGFCCQTPTVHSLLSSQKDPIKPNPNHVFMLPHTPPAPTSLRDKATALAAAKKARMVLGPMTALASVSGTSCSLQSSHTGLGTVL